MPYRPGTLADLQSNPGYVELFLTNFEEVPDRIFEGTHCRRWTGWINEHGLNNNGHGRWHVLGMTFIPHRVIHELYIGPIPAGYEVDHRCRFTACGEWRHLEAVTHEENKRRGAFYRLAAEHRAAELCPEGHVYDEANTYWRKDGTGRGCRRCRYEANLRWVAKTQGLSVDELRARRSARPRKPGSGRKRVTNQWPTPVPPHELKRRRSQPLDPT